MADTEQQLKIDHDRNVAFYAAALNAFYSTSLEYDKGIFTLAAGGLGLLVTLLTAVGVTSRAELFAYLIGIITFFITLLLLLWVFRLNKTHIIAVVEGDDELSTKRLRAVEFASMVAFGIGVTCATVVGIQTAINSYDTKVTAMTDKKAEAKSQTRSDSVLGVRNLRPDVLQKSFLDAGKLRPQANTGASSAATPNAKPAADPPTQSSSAQPAVPASNATPKGQ